MLDHQTPYGNRLAVNDYGTMTTEYDDAPIPVGSSPLSVDILGILLRRKWIITAGLFLGIACTLFQYAQTPPTYESSSQIIIHESSNDALPVSYTGSRGSTYWDRQASKIDHKFVITTPLIIKEAVAFGGLADVLQAPDPVATIQAGISATAGNQRDNQVVVRFRSSNPKQCQPVVNELVAAYGRFLAESEDNVGLETGQLIRDAEKNLRISLEKQTKAYKEFRDKAPLFFKDGQAVNIYNDRQSDIEARRSEIRIRTAEVRGRIKAAEEAEKLGMVLYHADDLRPSIETSYDYVARIREQSLVNLELDLIAAQRIYGKDHPRVRMISRQMDTLRKSLKSESIVDKSDEDSSTVEEMNKRYLDGLRLELAQGERELEKLEEIFEAEQSDAEKLSRFLVEDQIHRENIQRTKQLFDTVVNRLQEVNLLEAVGTNKYKLQTLFPTSIATKVAPRVSQFIISGTVFGLIGGFGLAFFLDRSDRAFRSPEDVGATLQTQLLGHIPEMEIQPDQLLIPELDRCLAVVHKPKSHVAEAYRAIRTSIYFNSQGSDCQIIQVTSPVPGDGKSTTAANLAVAVAQSGKHVLLIDGDLRRPVVHKRFGITPELGLSSVLDGEVALNDAVHGSAVKNLDILPCGPKPDRPSELLTSIVFEKLLGEIRNQFDFVVIDSPPLLAVTDPSIISARVDGVVVVLRLRKNARQLATQCRAMLSELGANLVGAVINGESSKGKGQKSYKYGGRYYNSRYGYGGYGYGYGRNGGSTVYGYGHEDGVSKYFQNDDEVGATTSSGTGDTI